MNKTWKTIPGYGGNYLINSQGEVYSKKSKKILKHIIKSDGYLGLHLSHQNISKNVLVHRLVAEAFLDNPEHLPVVNHIDGKKDNPDVSNLEWVTYQDNSLHAFKTGLNFISDKCKRAVSKIAAENGAKTTSKRVIQKSLDGEVVASFLSIRDAARLTGIPRDKIGQVCAGKQYRKTAGGYLWEYAEVANG